MIDDEVYKEWRSKFIVSCKIKPKAMKQLVDWTLEEIMAWEEFISIEKVKYDPLQPTMYLVTFESATRDTENPLYWVTVTGTKIPSKRYTFHTYLTKSKQ